MSEAEGHAMNPRPSTEAPVGEQMWPKQTPGGSVKISELYTSSLVMPAFDLCPFNTSLSKPNISETPGTVYLPRKSCGRSTPGKGLLRGDWSTFQALSDWHGYEPYTPLLDRNCGSPMFTAPRFREPEASWL